MTTAVDVCNMALALIGRRDIASLGEASAEAGVCLRFYDHARRAFIMSSAWSFALRRQALAQTAGDFDARWAYRYARPNEALKILRLIADEASLQFTPLEVPYEVRERAIYTNAAGAIAEIIADEEDITTYGPLAVDAFAYTLATYIATPLTRSTKLLQEMRREQMRAMSIAVTADATQQYNKDGPEIDAYTAARR